MTHPHVWLSHLMQDGRLTPTQKLVAATLWTFMDRQGMCWPGVEAIGQRAGIRKRDTVRAALIRLEELGHLHIRTQPRGRYSTNEYRAVDNSSGPPRNGSRGVTRLTDFRPPVERGPLGPPRNGSLTIPEGTNGDRSRSPVDNTHPWISYLADSTYLP